MHYLYLTVSFYAILLLIVLFGQTVRAAPLMKTDDAGIVDPGHCQVELDQVVSDSQISQVNLTPACNFANVEFGLPLSWDDGEQRYALQAKKTLFQAERVPVALAASLTWQPKQQHEKDHVHLNIPVSYYLNDHVQIDANLGMYRQDHDNETTWAVASTYSFADVHGVSLEFFKLDSDKTSSQVVYHYHVIPDQVSLFASYGHALNSSDKSWAGLGISWAMARSKNK
ncbi:hypothetical protein [Acinetobacter rudis]|uniref:Transporter n=1 Tax=Acinetobacter rudis TaxID=632955 RepID=A0AAW8J995_9GAMM|nr:hypothetical protein [Acinetobacter rudis]MDQ8935745.1 hypothetical protein [Acinetobacter rudis]MDQ8952133.1 hypothetical protein [Acinetobacter rudis]MDQ9018054.1 hypothetical protein [Acinetobacter rudis]